MRVSEETEHLVVVTGASSVPNDVADRVPGEAIVLGVDAGFDLALAAGLRPYGLIGDMDSISSDGQDWARRHATISRHPTDKNETDTELALAFAADMNPQRLTMIGGGDRLDHTVAALGALGAANLTGVPEIDAWWDGEHLDVVHGPGRRTLQLEPGSTLSLLALGRRCERLAIDGVRWPLEKFELAPVVGRGISNEVVDPDGRVTISLSHGVVWIFDTPSTPTPDRKRSTPR